MSWSQELHHCRELLQCWFPCIRLFAWDGTALQPRWGDCFWPNRTFCELSGPVRVCRLCSKYLRRKIVETQELVALPWHNWGCHYLPDQGRRCVHYPDICMTRIPAGLPWTPFQASLHAMAEGTYAWASQWTPLRTCQVPLPYPQHKQKRQQV